MKHEKEKKKKRIEGWKRIQGREIITREKESGREIMLKKGREKKMKEKTNKSEPDLCI